MTDEEFMYKLLMGLTIEDIPELVIRGYITEVNTTPILQGKDNLQVCHSLKEFMLEGKHIQEDETIAWVGDDLILDFGQFGDH
jgi:hypothetical protein